MAVETAQYIAELNAAWPTDGDDCTEGDNHIRLTKDVLQKQFPNFTAAPVNASEGELNHSVGVTSGIQAQLDALDAKIDALSLWVPGDIKLFAGNTPPSATEWVPCDGSAYDGNVGTYAALWAAIGTQFGGAGIGNFEVPDLRKRAPVHPGQLDGTTGAVVAQGDKYGAPDHTLTGPQSGVKEHTHGGGQAPNKNHPTGPDGNTSWHGTAQDTGGVVGGAQNADEAHPNEGPRLAVNYYIKL